MQAFYKGCRKIKDSVKLFSRRKYVLKVYECGENQRGKKGTQGFG